MRRDHRHPSLLGEPGRGPRAPGGDDTPSLSGSAVIEGALEPDSGPLVSDTPGSVSVSTLARGLTSPALVRDPHWSDVGQRGVPSLSHFQCRS